MYNLINDTINHSIREKIIPIPHSILFSRVQAASTSTLMVPWLFAVRIVGRSLFQHTALMKYDPASSSASSISGDPNLWQVKGLEISWKGQLNPQYHKRQMHKKTTHDWKPQTLWYTKTSFVSLPHAMYSLLTVRPTKFFSFAWPLKVRTCTHLNENEKKLYSYYIIYILF